VLSRHLERLGYTPEIAVDGVEAVVMLAEQRFDLVFMDCQMPNMDGFTATRHIRATEAADGRHVPIIAMTAHAMAGDREACLAAGMDDYLSKPLTSAMLQAALQRWLGAGAAKEPSAERQPAPAQALITAPVLDPAVLAGLRELNSPDEPDIVVLLIDMFLPNAETLFAQMRAGIAARNPGELEIAAHSLKGSASNLGATELTRLCKQLEHAAHAGQFDQADQQLSAIEYEFVRVRAALEAERAACGQPGDQAAAGR
jgi:two-component system, sensor histidine kinase and response regulator